jgi:predicted transcriptional regulator YdeE
MKEQIIEKFDIIGISVRTTNENAQAAIDIPKLWEKFMTESIIELIPNKIDSSIYCLYTDYEKDHTMPYTTILGCKVEHLSNIPSGMVGKAIETSRYTQFIAKGNLNEGAVFNAWTKIWNCDLNRAYSVDFEIYSEKAQSPSDAEVDIYIAIK